jgi:hypothetical protein
MKTASNPARPAPSLIGELGDLLRTLAQGLFASYRPERHYMRGPGPRWHAKHRSGEALSASPFFIFNHQL